MSLNSYANSTRPSPLHSPLSPTPIIPAQLTPLPLQTEKVCIITTDGRNLVGTLVAFDNTTNLVCPLPPTPSLFEQQLTPPPPPTQVLKSTVERVIRSPEDGEPSSEVPHGLYVVRGENVCLIGLVDETLDESINWTEVKGAPIGTTKH